jgi:hypothetical protein
MKYYIMAAVAFLTLSLTTPAKADPEIFARSGEWAAYGGPLSDGSMVCGITIVDNNGQTFNLKHFDKNDHFEVDLASPSWKVPENLNINLTVRIDEGTIFRATPGKDINSTNGIYWFIGKDIADQFEEEFRDGDYLRISFSGNISPWVISLSGTNNIMDAFVACLKEKQRSIR